MSVVLIGRCGFEDANIPLKGKTEWGVDTMIRKMTGARMLAEAFIGTLAQGQGFNGYSLQSWEVDDNPHVATITLFYKGFATGGTPVPKIISQIVPSVGSISAVYTGENDGKGRVYKTIPLYNLQYGRPEAGVVFDEVIATREVYTQGATLEFTYDAVETVYRYIHVGKPNGPSYFSVDIPRVPVIKRARLATADGSVYGKNKPSVFNDLAPIPLLRLISFQSEPIIGTPFWQCEDVVRRELGEGDSDTEGQYGGG